MKNKKTIFRIFIALIPIVFLVLLEITLRLFNAFPQTPLFNKVYASGQEFIEINSTIGERYFNKKVMPVPNLYPQRFPVVKPENTMRIFCMGGSTTAGFPYEMTVPFPQQLEMLLKTDYPTQNFEIINMGLSAINSFTIVDWLPDVLQQEPDLILFYLGHNEFYGAYGTGSTISLGNNPRVIRLVLKLRKLHLFQLINSITQSLTPTPDSDLKPTLMEKVIDSKFIAANSVLRMKTHNNFSDNLDVILSTCQAEGVPVILSNLVSNIKDQQPLDITSDPNRKSSKASELFLKGQREFEQGDTATAYISLSRARNHDEVPFRADETFNEILETKASQYNSVFVDMEQAFQNSSSSGIPGTDLFSDHLHPNPLGYYLMAREFQKELVRSGIISPASEKQYPGEPLLVTDLDWEIGSLRLFKLLQRWPFGDNQVDYSNYPPLIDKITTRIASDFLFNHHIWGKAHDEMAAYYLQGGDLINACREYQAILEMNPEKIEYYTKLVDCASKTRQWDLVQTTCEQALPRTSQKGMFYYHLAHSLKIDGALDSALVNIRKASEAPELTPTQAANVNFAYANLLVDLQQPMDAKIVLQKLLKKMPAFPPALTLIKKLNKMLGDS